MLYVSVHCKTVNIVKNKNACLFLWLITSVIKTLNNYFLGCSFMGKFKLGSTKEINKPKQRNIETKQANKIEQTKTQRKATSNSSIL